MGSEGSTQLGPGENWRSKTLILLLSEEELLLQLIARAAALVLAHGMFLENTLRGMEKQERRGNWGRHRYEE